MRKPKGAYSQPHATVPAKESPQNYTFAYSPRWNRSFDDLDPKAQEVVVRHVRSYANDPANASFRQQQLVSSGNRNAYSIDVGRYGAAFYKAIFKKEKRNVTFLWVGTHSNYNREKDSKWLEKA